VTFDEIVEAVGKGVDGAGVGIIVVGVIASSARFLFGASRRPSKDPSSREDADRAYRQYRQGLGRSILLGLEFLVAGDIIRTVGISPTFRSVGILATIVLIRTFLSIALQIETEGRWPWPQGRRSSS
jgi:uncharacterized membrane protein